MLTMPKVRELDPMQARPIRRWTPRSSGCSSSSRWSAFYLANQAQAEALGAQRRLADAESAAQAAQVRALRYQVNPHFLFNTLNSLSSLVMTGRTDRAETMLLALSTFFRTSLSLDPSADVTLAEEIDLQRLYLDIEKARFPDRLHVEIDVPQELEQARLPALLLQPIVENAHQIWRVEEPQGRRDPHRRASPRRPPHGARDQQSFEERRQGRTAGRHARRNGPRPCKRLPAARSALGRPRELPIRADDRRRVQGFAHNAGGDAMSENKPLRVLIADDEPLAAERLQLLLARADGAQLVGTASDGESAINLTKALNPDLLLLDIAMPGLDGIGVARALTEQSPSPAVVFVTAFDQFAVAAFEVEAVDYLMKPVDPHPAPAGARPRTRLS